MAADAILITALLLPNPTAKHETRSPTVIMRGTVAHPTFSATCDSAYSSR